MLLLLILFFHPFHLRSMSAAPAAGNALPGCEAACGDIAVPYPFGIGPDCHHPGFQLTCNDTYDPPKLFIGTGNIVVTSITLDNLFIAGPFARDCYQEPQDANHVWIDLNGTPYTFSYARSRFTAIGCDSIAIVYSSNGSNYASGCMALCRDGKSVVNGSCSGIGCCQTYIPRGLKRFDSSLQTLYNHNRTASFSPCSFAFLVDEEQFEFSVADFYDYRERSSVPVALDWAVGNATCSAAKRTESYLCGSNSYCSDSTNGPGYRCRCAEGYGGNPYLAGGCQDVNECEDANESPCVDICTNTAGSFMCSCSHGSTGDGRKDGSGCTSSSKAYPLVKVVLGSGLGFLSLLVTSSLLYWGLKKRRLSHLRDKFFKQNGGLLLERHISGAAADTFNIFTAGELAKATDNYSQARIIGRGGNGTVYKATLPDHRVVAIKKSMAVDETQVEQFINEVVILSQVVHRNLVKILGCCLETQVPLLVYEYIPNGTLSHHLANRSSLSWESRLLIAVETAGALAYLHSSTAAPIVHRDVKSSNILLDENYRAKVSDFGASTWVPLGRAHLTTMVQGTLGYLDPEYFQTGQLTAKSDVYSFGVVLAELMTGERPISEQRPEEERGLAMHFILAMERGVLRDVVEGRVVSEADGAQLEAVARLAKRCLRMTGEERPTMREVAEELEQARRVERHPWAQVGGEEERSGLLGEPGLTHQPIPLAT